VWDVCGGGYLCGMCVEEDTCVGCVWRRILVWDVCGGGYLECVFSTFIRRRTEHARGSKFDGTYSPLSLTLFFSP